MANKKNKQLKSEPSRSPRHALSGTADIKQHTQKKISSLTVKLALLLGLISFAIYANTLKNGFALDDNIVLKENTLVSKGIQSIPALLSTPHLRGYSIISNDTYRPLSLVTFAVEFEFFGFDPFPYHFINILLYAGCVILLFLFLNRFFERRKTFVSFIAALLFTMHPIHTEVVANIKSRDELLCFFFTFFAMNVFIKYLDTGKIKLLITGAACFLLSLLSKETAITFLAVIPLIFFFYRNENKKRSIHITVSVFVVALIFLIARFSILNAYHANQTSDVSFVDNMLSGAPSVMAGLATKIEILGNYLKMLIFPYPLICNYSFNSFPFTGFGNPRVLISLAIYLFLAIYSIHGLMKKPKDYFVFSVLYFISTITLFSNIPFLIGTTMAERFLFFPSVSFCIIVALAIEKWILRSSNADAAAIASFKVLGIVIPVALIYAAIAVNRNIDWTDNLTLFKTDVNKSPNDARLAFYYGTELITQSSNTESVAVKQQMINDGITNLKRSLRVYADIPDAISELGNAFFLLGKNDSAEKYDKLALEKYQNLALGKYHKFSFELSTQNSITLDNLAGVYFVTQRYPLALEVCKRSVALNPANVAAYANEGLCFLRMHLPDSSLYYLYKAIAVNDAYKPSYTNMAITYKFLNKPDSAKKYDALAIAK